MVHICLASTTTSIRVIDRPFLHGVVPCAVALYCRHHHIAAAISLCHCHCCCMSQPVIVVAIHVSHSPSDKIDTTYFCAQPFKRAYLMLDSHSISVNRITNLYGTCERANQFCSFSAAAAFVCVCTV